MPLTAAGKELTMSLPRTFAALGADGKTLMSARQDGDGGQYCFTTQRAALATGTFPDALSAALAENTLGNIGWLEADGKTYLIRDLLARALLSELVDLAEEAI